jgi:hypothetical protein
MKLINRMKKINGTVGIDDLLRSALPRKRPEVRAFLCRAWVRANLEVKLSREPSDEEVQADLARLQQRRFVPFTIPFQMYCDQLLDFSRRFGQVRRTQRARKAAQERWAKKKGC